MSDDDILMDTIRAANADEEQVDDQHEEEVEEVESEEPQVFAGKYNSVEDLESAYKELERKFHESRQSVVEPPVEKEEPAVQYFGNEPSTEAELVAFAEQNPTDAAMWVIQNSERLPDELANAVLEHWWTMKPWEASQFWFEQRLAQERSEFADMTSPLVEQHERALMSEAYDHLLEAVPDYDEYQEQVEKFIEENDITGLLPKGADSDPVALAEGVGTIVGILKWREYQEAMRIQGISVPEENQPAPAKVSTRNTTIPSDPNGEDMDDLIRNMILNA